MRNNRKFLIMLYDAIKKKTNPTKEDIRYFSIFGKITTDTRDRRGPLYVHKPVLYYPKCSAHTHHILIRDFILPEKTKNRG